MTITTTVDQIALIKHFIASIERAQRVAMVNPKSREDMLVFFKEINRVSDEAATHLLAMMEDTSGPTTSG